MSNKSKSRMFEGTSLLQGDNTIPGLKLSPELKELLPRIFKEVHDFGCDFFPTVVQMLTYDEISEVAAYSGFPVRYPHWKWGMEYEELQRGYEHGMHRIYEMVINTNPCYIYCLDSNTMVDNVTVVAHALGHNDFFKNNIFFAPTRVGDQNMMNRLANHGTRIRRYMKRWGKERVTEFIDYVLRIETLIDATKAWQPKKIKNLVTSDSRKYKFPNRLNVKDGHEYMEDYINPSDWIENQNEKIRRKEIADEIGIFSKPTKDIMGFLRDHAPLKPWQADIIAMLYEESLYFAPQRMTKMMNEGWASYIDHNIMCKRGLCGLGQETEDGGVIEYAKNKMGVLGGRYSMNPYKLGFCMFNDIEERWDKGMFGPEYENCKDIWKKQNWDTKAGLGHKKVFEVRECHNDLTSLIEFFTEEFCNKYEFFQWRLFPNGEYKIVDRDYKSIKAKLVNSHINGGLPEINLTEPNYKGKGYMFLQHEWTGRTLYQPYVAATLQALCFLWGNRVYLATKDQNENEIVWCAYGPNDGDIQLVTREDYENEKGEEEGFDI
jgi:stage V sporulation protein R